MVPAAYTETWVRVSQPLLRAALCFGFQAGESLNWVHDGSPYSGSCLIARHGIGELVLCSRVRCRVCECVI